MGLDSGCAYLIIKDKQSGQMILGLQLDLNTIAGTGINVLSAAYDENNKNKQLPFHHISFLNIDNPKHIEIIKKMLQYGNSFIIGKQPSSNRKEYEDVMSYCLNHYLYRYFDFSDTNRIVSKMSKDEKKKFEFKLNNIINIDWNKIDNNLSECPRFRFRDYKDIDHFTIISDKNVRVQDPSFMTTPYMNPGKQYIEVPNPLSNNVDNRNIVISVSNDTMELSVDGKNVK